MTAPLTIYDILQAWFAASGASSPAPASWDYMQETYPSATQEVFKFRHGGASGTLIATLTVNYTDSTKANLDTATWA